MYKHRNINVMYEHININVMYKHININNTAAEGAPYFFLAETPPKSVVSQMGAQGTPKAALPRRARETPPKAAVSRVHSYLYNYPGATNREMQICLVQNQLNYKYNQILFNLTQRIKFLCACSQSINSFLNR